MEIKESDFDAMKKAVPILDKILNPPNDMLLSMEEVEIVGAMSNVIERILRHGGELQNNSEAIIK